MYFHNFLFQRSHVQIFSNSHVTHVVNPTIGILQKQSTNPCSYVKKSRLPLILLITVWMDRTKDITDEDAESSLWYSTKNKPNVLYMPTVKKYSTVLPVKEAF